MGQPVTRGADWAFYADGTESGSVINGTKNVNPTKGDLQNDTIYLFRFGMEETSGNDWNPSDVQLEYDHNAAGPVIVNGSSSVVQSVATGNIADGADTTQRITAFTHQSTNAGFDEVDGALAGVTLNADGFECLFAFQIIGSDVSDNDTIVFHVREVGGGNPDLDSYLQTDPTVTVEVISSTDVRNHIIPAYAGING